MKVKNQSFSDIIHSDLLATQELVYNPCNLDCSDLIHEPHNADYGAYIFNLNALSIRFRVAKITPTKIGQFVTLWERIEDGPIQPYDISDPADLFVISTRTENHFGQFVFPKAVLGKQIYYPIMVKVEKEQYVYTRHGIIPQVVRLKRRKNGSWNIS